MLKRRSVTKKVKSDPTVCEDFFLLVVEANILYAVMTGFGMSSLEDTPSETQFSGFAIKNENERKNIFFQRLNNIIDSSTWDVQQNLHVHLSNHMLNK